MTQVDPGTYTAWGAAVAAFCYGMVERIRSNRVTQKTEAESETLSLAKASEERANIHHQIAEDYKELLEKERIEHKATRDFWHDENGKNQVLLGAANLKVMELQDRPDLRDILTVLKAQGEGIKEILIILARQVN